MKNKLEGVKDLSGDHIICRFDVNALFPPIKLVCKIIEKNWDEIKKSTTMKSKYMYLEVPMKECLSVNISDIFMNHVFDRVLELTKINSILLVTHVDNI